VSAPHVLDIAELARMLDQHAASLAPELLPNGRREGRYWATSNISDVRTGSYSLKVNLDGPRIGLWTDFGAPQGARDRAGDMLKLVALVQFGGDLGEACKWARSWLGIDGLDPERLAKTRAEVAQRQRQANEQARAKAEQMERRARGLWGEKDAAGREIAAHIEGTPAEAYLRGRGIALDRLPRYPRSLRFHPRVFCGEAKEAGERDPFLPALIACVLDMEGRHRATHRIWIKPDGSGKADLAEPKKCLGSFWGRYIPLWKGAADGPLHSVPEGTGVDASEGIEDGLTVAVARPERRVIAAVTLGNIGQLQLPERIGTLTVIGQNDENAQAQAALDAALAQQAERCPDRELRLFKPPAELAA
jgi:hypothetical protein